MERAAVQAAVESARHRPALYWGVVSAAALCSVWGTLALAKRSKSGGSAGTASPGVHAFKRLRRQYAENLRPLLEDLVYLSMFLLNLLVGLFYWVVDSVLEGRPVSPQTIAISSILSRSADSEPLLETRPRRGQIKRLRTKWAWARSKPSPNRCECWGWNVKDLAPDGNHSEIQTEKVDGETPVFCFFLFFCFSAISTFVNGKDISAQELMVMEWFFFFFFQDGEDGITIPPRWSECHCDQCAPLLMPMRMAEERLHVISEESFRATRGGKLADECSFNGQQGTAVIFIHGLFSSATFWFDTEIALNLSEDVKEQHRVLAPDLLGCGRSPRPVDGLYTLADHVEAIEKSVIQRYKLQSFHLVGHSMGSIIALALAARCPQRVRSISLIAPVYPPCCLREDGELAQIPCDAFFSSLDPLTVSSYKFPVFLI
jgi:hypothetical protein